MPNYYLQFLFSGVVVLVYLHWRRRMNRRSISVIKGPPVKSVLFGNLGEIFQQENVGDLEFSYARKYGSAWRLRAPFKSDILVVVDPCAIQHIFSKGGYIYPKTAQTTVLMRMVSGFSVAWAPTGEVHARHRRALAPGFKSSQLPLYISLFSRIAKKVSGIWQADVLVHAPLGATIEVSKWIRGLTLDVIGEAVLEYDFEVLDGGENELASAYHNMFSDVTRPSKAFILYQALWTYLPTPLLDFVEHIPLHPYRRVLRATKIARDIAEGIITGKSSSEREEQTFMNILLQANASPDPSIHLNHDETVSNLAALILAGFDTSGSSLLWILYELAHFPVFQEELRAEIRQTRASLSAHGRSEFTAEDLDGMPLLQACIKETFRFHPIVYNLERVASRDDIIPLAEPVTTSTGEVISHIPVGNGQVVIASVGAYNRLPSLWGQDAHVWNPKRFMNATIGGTHLLGTYANLLTFSAGVRGCMGMKFAVAEMQSFIVELLENFKFEPPRQEVEILRSPTPIMIPLVKGEQHKGLQMPLHVSPAPQRGY